MGLRRTGDFTHQTWQFPLVFLAFGRIYIPLLCFSRLYQGRSERSDLVCDGMSCGSKLKAFSLHNSLAIVIFKPCLGRQVRPLFLVTDVVLNDLLEKSSSGGSSSYPPDAANTNIVDLGRCPRMPHASCALIVTSWMVSSFSLTHIEKSPNQSAHHILWAGLAG